MKFKTFRTIVIGVAAVASLGMGALAFRACSRSEPKADTEAPPQQVAASTPTSPPAHKPTSQGWRSAGGEAKPAEPGGLRAMDQRILERVKQPVADKVKDAFKTEPYKVNLYNEGGAIRAKVDLDRDEKADEKWDFEDDAGKQVVKRRVSSRDDEAYDLEYRLVEGRWVEKKP
jgi:hypothetical protein